MMLYALLSAAKGWSQPGFGLKTPLAFRSSLLGLRPSVSSGRADTRGEFERRAWLQRNPQTMAFPCSRGCRATAGTVGAASPGTPPQPLPGIAGGCHVSPSCQAPSYAHRWVLSSLFGCSMTISLIYFSLAGPRSLVFLKAVNQVRNNSFSLEKL